MTGKEIAIIGAGISGLLACKSAIQKGFSPVILEARNCIGGVWSNNIIETTKLQTPKNYYQFSDFVWPAAAAAADDDRNNNFPDHKQVMEYLYSYASHFNVFPRIKFNSKVIAIDYCCTNQPGGDRDLEMRSSELWSGTGQAFNPYGKWNVIVHDDDLSSSSPKVTLITQTHIFFSSVKNKFSSNSIRRIQIKFSLTAHVTFTFLLYETKSIIPITLNLI